MKHHVLHEYRFSLGLARQLVADVPDERMVEIPKPGMNHAAWVLGHLVVTADFMGALLGQKRDAPEDWQPLFKPGSTPQADRSLYPEKELLIEQLVNGHERVAAAFAAASKQQLAADNPVEGFNKVFPTIGDAVVFGLTTHEGFHLGQLSAWRRALGYKNLLSE